MAAALERRMGDAGGRGANTALVQVLGISSAG